MDNVFGAGGPDQWFRSLPIITRTWLGSVLLITALANLDVLKWSELDLRQWQDVVRGPSGKMEAWRLITCFLYAGKFGWNALIGLHMMTQMSNRYETMGPICTRRMNLPPPYNGNNNTSPYYPRGESADYAFALLFGMVGILLSQFLLFPYLPYSLTQGQHYIFFHRHLTFYVVYIWSKHYPLHRVNLFGVAMAAAYLPYAYLLMGYALNNGQVLPIDMLHGMFIGHVYYYLACVVPEVLRGRLVVIATPEILVGFFHWIEVRGVGGGGIDVGGGGVGGDEDNQMLVNVDDVIGG